MSFMFCTLDFFLKTKAFLMFSVIRDIHILCKILSLGYCSNSLSLFHVFHQIKVHMMSAAAEGSIKVLLVYKLQKTTNASKGFFVFVFFFTDVFWFPSSPNMKYNKMQCIVCDIWSSNLSDRK